jgi:hypothetical protein
MPRTEATIDFMKQLEQKVCTSYSFALSTVLLGLLVCIQWSQAQGKESVEVIQNRFLKPETKEPIGTKRGLDELKAVLKASEPTQFPEVRKVIISTPVALPDFIKLHEAGNTAIREFFLIADPTSFSLKKLRNHTAVDLESTEGVKAKLSGRGTIALRVWNIKADKDKFCRSVGELTVRDRKISGYEKVRKIEFDIQLKS